MNIAYLKTFYTVVIENSFSKAAKTLDYSQSNVSYHIRKLEEYYQTILLYKELDQIILTDQGKQVFTFADELLVKHSLLLDNLSNNSQPLIIGTIESIASFILPVILSYFRKQNPKTKLQIIIRTEKELINLFENDKIDVLIIFDEILFLNRKFAHFYAKEKLQLISTTDIDFPNKDRSDMIFTDQNCSYRKAFLKEYSTQVNIVLELDNPEDIRKILMQGNELSILPNYVVRSEDFSIFNKKELLLEKDFYLQLFFADTKNNSTIENFLRIFFEKFDYPFLAMNYHNNQTKCPILE